MLPLNGCLELGSRPSGITRSTRSRAGVLDVGAGGVEVGVVGHDLAVAADRREQDPLRRPTLMGRDHVLEREQVPDAFEEPEPRRRPGVDSRRRASDRRPLVARHRPGARVREEIDQYVLGAESEQVVACMPDRLATIFRRGHHERFDRVDAKRFDDRVERHEPIMRENLREIHPTRSADHVANELHSRAVRQVMMRWSIEHDRMAGAARRQATDVVAA